MIWLVDPMRETEKLAMTTSLTYNNIINKINVKCFKRENRLFIAMQNSLQNKGIYDILSSMLTKTKKSKVIKDVQVHDKDTGSPEVQIAILTRRIDELASHLKKNAKDNHSRRGLLQMVADRKTHMKYLEKKNPKRYSALVKKIGLKK